MNALSSKKVKRTLVIAVFTHIALMLFLFTSNKLAINDTVGFLTDHDPFLIFLSGILGIYFVNLKCSGCLMILSLTNNPLK